MRPLPIEEMGSVLVVRIGQNSALNELETSGLRQAVYDALAARPSPLVAIDLTGVDSITSTGIALLIGTKRRVDAAEGQLVLFGLHPDIHDLFNSMKLTALFDIADSATAALALFPSLPAS
jgi:anti-sigma B factor antagonist